MNRELLTLIRSYVEQSAFSKSTRYALIEHRGVKRWHLLHHSEESPKLPRGAKSTQHHSIGELSSLDLGRVENVRVLTAKRVPILLGDHPELGPLVLKGLESDGGRDLNREHLPPRLPSKPESSRGVTTAGWLDWQGDRDDDKLSRGRDLGAIATYMAKTITALGGITPDFRVMPIGELRRVANEAYGSRWWEHPDQKVAVQNYLGSSPMAKKSSSDEEHLGYAERIKGRLLVADALLGTPDRHEENYVKMPYYTPDGTITTVTAGIDYEFPAPGHEYGVLPPLHPLRSHTPLDPEGLFRQIQGFARPDQTQSSLGLMDGLSRIERIRDHIALLPSPAHQRAETILHAWNTADPGGRTALSNIKRRFQEAQDAGDIL